MKKAKVTKTINPLPFEALEPHRFEDLVRRLLYAFRDWSSIEPTGSAGSDDGYDARAWERTATIANVDDEGEVGSRAVEESRWQIQAKREKSISPGKMRRFIRDGIDAQDPPYGYILAAATNPSKKALDAFRDEAKKKGVKEFYFWGKHHLEDQLSLPKNDEALFTFFGLSLSPRRRSRVTEIRFGINNKNKIQKLLFGTNDPQFSVPRRHRFLLRDVKDEHYPDALHYEDFESSRRWEEHSPFQLTPAGIWFHAREWFAYCDREKKTWDVTRTVDLTGRQHSLDAANRARLEDVGKKVERYWRHLRLSNQAKLKEFGFVSFDDILLIDDKGDVAHSFPHVFVDFGKDGPFSEVGRQLLVQREPLDDDIGFTRTAQFPVTFPATSVGAVHTLSTLALPAEMVRGAMFGHGSHRWFVFDGKMDNVREGDIVDIPSRDGHSDKQVEVTRIYDMTAGDLLAEHAAEAFRVRELEAHAGRAIAGTDAVRVCEVCSVFLSDRAVTYFDVDD